MTVEDCVITECTVGVAIEAAENAITIRGSTFYNNQYATFIYTGDSAVVMQENLAALNGNGFIYFDRPVIMIRNNSWGNTYWDYKDSSDPLLTGNLRESPQWCNLEDLTLYINSPCGKPCSPFDPPVQIGARGVACASGLQTEDDVAVTTSDLEAGEILLLSDYRVQSGQTLTLGAGVDVTFDPTDEYNLGSSSTVTELSVDGTLYVNGTNSSKVTFRRIDPDTAWGSIWVEGGKLFMTHGDVSGSERGIAVASNDTISIANSVFSDNLYAVQLGGVCSLVDVSGSVFQDNLYGIDIQLTDQDSLTISNNRFEGNSSSLAGIYFNPGTISPTGAATVNADTASGYSTAAALYIGSAAPVVTECHFTDNKYGIEITDGTPSIGTSSSSSDNNISGNTRGIYVHCTKPTNCPATCTVVPVIRNNFIDSNTHGVVTEKTTAPDLGTGSGDKGLNTITNSTTYCIWNRATSCTTSVQAYGNYFGTCTMGLPPVCWNGLVNVGTSECSAPAGAGGNLVAIELVSADNRPVYLRSILPNPAIGKVGIQFGVNVPNRTITIDVFDVAGRLVKNVISGDYGTGVHEVAWNGDSENGSTTSAGLYFIRITSGSDVLQTSKVLVLR